MAVLESGGRVICRPGGGTELRYWLTPSNRRNNFLV
jgi:hypothetical protein